MPGRASTVTAGLLERDGEVQRLEQAIAAAVDEAGSVVAVEGEAGIGKTSLLAQANAIASAAGMRALRARGGQLERKFAYGVVRQLFEGPMAAADPADRERWLRARRAWPPSCSRARSRLVAAADRTRVRSCTACTGCRRTWPPSSRS